MSPISHLLWIVGWLLLIVGTPLAYFSFSGLAVAGAILVAGDHIAQTIRLSNHQPS